MHRRLGFLFPVLVGVSTLLAAVAFVLADPSPPIPQPPQGRGGPPIQAGDRVYTADQISNTVSVIDPTTNTLLGTLPLGNQQPDDLLGALYNRAVGVHGLGFSPDGRFLAVVSVTSNGVTLVDTATNQVKGTVYVGRAPHEGFFTPDGKELWVAVRGENYVSVIDPEEFREITRIPTMEAVAMVAFSPDGKVAFVDSSRTAEVDAIDVATHTVMARIPVASPFSPNLMVTPDGAEVWLTHKDVGKVTVLDARALAVKDVLDTGRVTNHVNFVSKAEGDYAYVTVGGENVVRVLRRGDPPEVVGTIPVGAVPHGLWPSPDSSRLYVGLEDGDAVQVIDTTTDQVVATIPTGQGPQALVYVARGGALASAEGLGNQGIGQPPRQIELKPLDANSSARGNAVVRRLRGVDQLAVSVEGLAAGDYRVLLADAARSPFGATLPVAALSASAEGRGRAQVLMLIFGQSVSGRSLDHLVVAGLDGSALLSDGGASDSSGPLGLAGP